MSDLPADAEPAEVSDRLIDRDGRILSLKGLDYVGECIFDLERRLAENEALKCAAIERAESRAAALAAPLERELERRKGQAAAYLQQHRDEVIPKGRKTRELPSGLVVGFRSPPVGYRWSQAMKPAEREAALLAWAKAMEPHVEEIKLTRPGPEKPDLEEIKKLLAFMAEGLKEPADAPPGLEYIPEGSEEMVINVKEKP